MGTEKRTVSASMPARSMRVNQLEKMSSPTSARSRVLTRSQRARCAAASLGSTPRAGWTALSAVSASSSAAISFGLSTVISPFYGLGRRAPPAVGGVRFGVAFDADGGNGAMPAAADWRRTGLALRGIDTGPSPDFANIPPRCGNRSLGLDWGCLNPSARRSRRARRRPCGACRQSVAAYATGCGRVQALRDLPAAAETWGYCDEPTS